MNDDHANWWKFMGPLIVFKNNSVRNSIINCRVVIVIRVLSWKTSLLHDLENFIVATSTLIQLTLMAFLRLKKFADSIEKQVMTSSPFLNISLTALIIQLPIPALTGRIIYNPDSGRITSGENNCRGSMAYSGRWYSIWFCKTRTARNWTWNSASCSWRWCLYRYCPFSNNGETSP